MQKYKKTAKQTNKSLLYYTKCIMHEKKRTRARGIRSYNRQDTTAVYLPQQRDNVYKVSVIK